jgi:hypothetical protein
MGNENHKPAGPGGGQFSSGQTSTGVTNTVRERQAMRAMTDKRKFAQGRTSIRGIEPTPSMATKFARHQASQGGGGGGGGGGQGGGGQGGGSNAGHMRGIHNATKNKTLDSNPPFNPDPKVLEANYRKQHGWSGDVGKHKGG